NYFAEERRLLWMKNHYRARPDRIFYIFTVSVLEIFKREEFGTLIQVGRKSKGQVLDILRRRDVEAMSDETIEKHVLFIAGRCTIESVTYSGLYYELSLAVNLIQGCSCEYFTRHHRLCKHMLMAVRKFSILRLPHGNNFRAPNVLGAAATATLKYKLTEESK
ncbi:hypothetical protein BGX29_005672, partial [Mortierella sp. GBA35]